MDYSKEKIINAIIEEFEENQPVKILAQKSGFVDPYKISLKSSSTGHFPDIIAVSKKFIHIFSVETNIGKKIKKEDLEKWKSFSIYAKAKGGHLYLAGTKNDLARIENAINEKISNIKYLEIV